VLAAAAVLGSDAQTSASAGAGRFGRPGSATATANYEGDAGFARTDTRSGTVNIARGIAVGVDENGIALSISTAIAPRRGPAVATNFSIAIGNDGTATSDGLAVSVGPAHRSVAAAGGVGAEPFGSQAISTASASSDRLGHAWASTHARHAPIRGDSGPVFGLTPVGLSPRPLTVHGQRAARPGYNARPWLIDRDPNR
jgi:hypothetical protein